MSDATITKVIEVLGTEYEQEEERWAACDRCEATFEVRTGINYAPPGPGEVGSFDCYDETTICPACGYDHYDSDGAPEEGNLAVEGCSCIRSSSDICGNYELDFHTMEKQRVEACYNCYHEKGCHAEAAKELT